MLAFSLLKQNRWPFEYPESSPLSEQISPAPDPGVRHLAIACLIAGGADVVLRFILRGTFGPPLWVLALVGFVLLKIHPSRTSSVGAVILLSALVSIWATIGIVLRIIRPDIRILIVPTVGYFLGGAVFVTWGWVVLWRMDVVTGNTSDGEAAAKIGYSMGGAVRRWRRQ